MSETGEKMFCFDGDEHGMLTESEHLSLLSDGNDYPSCQLSVHRPQTCCEGQSTREHTCLVLLEKMDWFIFFLHVVVSTPVLNSKKENWSGPAWSLQPETVDAMVQFRSSRCCEHTL